MASNWHIDIASELEEYLSELEHIRIQFEPSQLSQSQSQSQSSAGLRSLNFAQAALLIQGSACIYSRKVEYLYALLYQTLDVLISSRRSKQAASSIVAATGDDLDAALLLSDQSEARLLDLDDTMHHAQNIDLDEQNDEQQHDQVDALDTSSDQLAAAHQQRQGTMIIRAPLSLLSDNLTLSGADAKSNVDSSTNDAQRAQQSLANQFKISNCVVHSSGALLLEEKENSLLRPNDRLELDPAVLRRMGLTATADNVPAVLPFGSPRGILLQNLQQQSEAEAAAAAAAAAAASSPHGALLQSSPSGGANSHTNNIALQLEDAFDALGGDGFDDDDGNEPIDHKFGGQKRGATQHDRRSGGRCNTRQWSAVASNVALRHSCIGLICVMFLVVLSSGCSGREEDGALG